jgi:hypothetical protein
MAGGGFNGLPASPAKGREIMEEKKQEMAQAEPKGETLEDIKKEVRARPQKPKKPKKRGPGRPTLEEQATKEAEAAAELALDVSAIKGMLEWIFGSLLTPRFGPHWKLKPDEAEAGAQAWGAVLNKYSPAASRFIEEIRAGMWTMGTVGPRWEKTKQLMMEQAAAQAAQEKAELKAAGQPA